jgi:predicted TIM-barrel fold metal-dependent hydrolase
VPLIDAHQHLASPEDARLLNHSLPEIAPPADIAALLEQLRVHWNDPAALAPLYAADAVALANYSNPNTGWKTGREAVSRSLATLFARPFAFTPVLVRIAGQEGRVAGYLSRGTGQALRHFGYFELALHREADGPWLVVSDSRVFQPRPEYQEPVDGRALLAKLDAAGIRYATVLSEAYWFDSGALRAPELTREQVMAQVRAENDWTAAQAEASGGRLLAFFSVNPLADDALDEMRRCAASHRFAGMKLHLQMSDVDLARDDDVHRLSKVFEEADRLQLPIVVHSQTRGVWGTAAARTFTQKVLPHAQHVPVTIAHLWGGGPFNAQALAVLVDFARSGAPGSQRLSFDVAEAALVANGDRKIDQQIADAIRAIGVQRIHYGSDAIGPNTLDPTDATAQFRKDIPLTPEEFDAITRNRPAYLPSP